MNTSNLQVSVEQVGKLFVVRVTNGPRAQMFRCPTQALADHLQNLFLCVGSN